LRFEVSRFVAARVERGGRDRRSRLQQAGWSGDVTKSGKLALTLIAVLSATAALSWGAGARAQSANVAVPFVGCAGEGMTGPSDPPPPRATPQVAAALASQLAYYASPDLSFLAPRGWNCAFVFGSGGTALTVTPTANSDAVCPGIVGRHISSGTSGRFDAAAIAARVFPSARAFVQGVINEKIPGGPVIQFGAYKSDKLTQVGADVVEYMTPARTLGLANADPPATNPWPVQGVAILLPKLNMDIIKLDACLPPAQAELASVIVKTLEAEVATGTVGGSD
jgi:hypothetical protein